MLPHAGLKVPSVRLSMRNGYSTEALSSGEQIDVASCFAKIATDKAVNGKISTSISLSLLPMLTWQDALS
jgi:hypothetical protein